MTADPDLTAAIEARVAQVEMARRIPDWDDRSITLPPDLPPLTRLAGRAFPSLVIEKRRRFQEIMGWNAPLPPEASLEDRVAVNGTETPSREEVAALDAFFDQQADAVDPAWRHCQRPDPMAATAWARVEAATMHGDRAFGRFRSGPVWSALSGAIWRLAEIKRQRWG